MEIYWFKAVSKRNGERIMSSSNSIAGKYKWNWKKVDYSAYLFILPVMIFFLSFVLYPMIKGVHLSLYRFRGRNTTFVGLKH